MTPKNMSKVALVGDLAPGEATVVEADGRCIALFNVEGTYYALDNTCTHRGGPLGEGKLNGSVVTCPWHHGQFDVRTGEVVERPGRGTVKTYRVQVEGDEVFIELD